MNKWIIASAVALLVGCESAVLVNNRPPAGTSDELNQPQPASATIEADNNDSSLSSGATTRPADQTVETQNVRIESR